MGHFVILLPLLLIVSWVMYRAYKQDRTNIYARYFRNFTWLWTSCTLIGATAVVVGGSVYAQLMGAAFSLPFHYFAAAALVGLPFALYRKQGFLSQLITFLTVAAGLFIGSVIFVKANNLFASLGPLQDFYMMVFKQLKYVRLGALVAVLIPLALFFLVEAGKATTASFRTRSFLIGLGTLIVAIFGGIHVFLGPVPIGFHIEYAELFVPLGFLVIFSGLIYGRKQVSPVS